MDNITGLNQQTPTAAEGELELEEIAVRTGKTINVTRRNLESYREYAKLEREWLTEAEVEHLKRAITFCEVHKRPLQFGLEQTDSDRAEPEVTAWPALKRSSDSEATPQPSAGSRPAFLETCNGVCFVSST